MAKISLLLVFNFSSTPFSNTSILDQILNQLTILYCSHCLQQFRTRALVTPDVASNSCGRGGEIQFPRFAWKCNDRTTTKIGFSLVPPFTPRHYITANNSSTLCRRMQANPSKSITQSRLHMGNVTLGRINSCYYLASAQYKRNNEL